MANNIREKINDSLKELGDKIKEQEWFQEAKSKWDELDSQTRTYIQYGGLGIVALGVIYIIVSAVIQSADTRANLNDKLALLSQIEAADQEIRQLRGQQSGGSTAVGGNWGAFIQTKGRTAGIKADKIKISAEKPGKSGELTEESLFDVTLEKINVRQLIQLAYGIESGNSPVKIRNLRVSTIGADGYLQAVIAMSGFKMKKTEN